MIQGCYRYKQMGVKVQVRQENPEDQKTKMKNQVFSKFRPCEILNGDVQLAG